MHTGLIFDPIFKQHDTGPHHPESSRRYDAIMDALHASGVDPLLEHIPSRVASDGEILLCHTRAYIDRAQRDIHSGRDTLSTGDTNVSEQSWDVAVKAAGGVLNSVDAVMAARVSNAFCVVRPPGHHASADRGMGFCVLNNIAIGARYAQHKHNLKRVLIADWDVHHGNGTQDIFYEDGSVLFFSTHQFPLYPGTGAPFEAGAGKGTGLTINCPFPAGAGRDEIVGAFRDKLIPAARSFKPDLVMISAGFDSRIGDPLGGFRLTDRDFAELTSIMLGIAAEHAGGRLISVLEGGYNLEGLGKAAVAHVKSLIG